MGMGEWESKYAPRDGRSAIFGPGVLYVGPDPSPVVDNLKTLRVSTWGPSLEGLFCSE